MQLVEGLENGSLFLREADRHPSQEKPSLSVGSIESVEKARRLAELSRKARRGQATTEELHELEQLEERFAPTSA
jgi:hypothetical protein